MLPTWLLITLYVLMGLACLVLGIRWWRRRSALHRELQSEAEQAAREQAAIVAKPATASTAVEQTSADVIRNAETTSPAGATSENISWQNRTLFTPQSGSHSVDNNDLPKVEPAQIPNVGTDDYFFGSATPTLAAMLPESDDTKVELKKELLAAGYHQPHAAENFSAIRYVAIIATMLFFGALLVLMPTRFEIPILAAIIIGPLVIWAVPRLILKSKATDRLSEIERGMPDTLDMLNMCVSQGMTIQKALHRVSKELRNVYPALAQELAIVVDHARIGTLEQALRNFSDRVDVPEVHSFVSLVIQTERMGTSVSDALADYSDSMRESLRQRANQKANQASFKLLFPTVLCLMPAVYLFLLSPALVELSNFFNSGGIESLRSGSDALRDL